MVLLKLARDLAVFPAKVEDKVNPTGVGSVGGRTSLGAERPRRPPLGTVGLMMAGVLLLLLLLLLVVAARGVTGRLPGNTMTRSTLPRPALIPAFPGSTPTAAASGALAPHHGLRGSRQTDKKVQRSIYM